MRTRGWIAAALVAATSVVVALGWPASDYPAPPAPVAEGEQLALYRESLDRQWADLSQSLGIDDEQPSAEAVEILPVRERDRALGRCLEEIGFTVTDYTSGVTYTYPEAGDDEAVAVGQFACESRYPYEVQLGYLMTVEQRSAMYDYYTGYLSSCLAFAGIEVTSAPPSHEEFVAASVQWPMWTPYEELWAGGMTQEEYLASGRWCPSDPLWRREANSLSAADG